MTDRRNVSLRARNQRIVELGWSRNTPLMVQDFLEFYEACRGMGASEEDLVSIHEDTSFFTVKWVGDGETN